MRHIDTEADCAERGHGHNIKRGSLDPLSEGGTRVPRWSAIVSVRGSNAMLTLGEDARLLLVGACCGSRVRVGGGSAPVEETHCSLEWVRLRS
jgi:hypothetical protein